MANTTGKKHGGRAKGTPNRKTFEFERLLKENNYDPLNELLKLLREDCFEKISDLLDQAESPEERVEILKATTLTLKDRAQLNMKMLDFLYPKLKAVEISTGPDTNIRAIKFVEKT